MGYTRMWFHVIPNLVSLWVVSPTLFSTPALMTALWQVELGSSWVQLTSGELLSLSSPLVSWF